MKIRTKLILAFLGVGLVPALAISAIVWNATQHMTTDVGTSLEGTAYHLVDKVERNLFERYGDVQAFGFNTVVQNKEVWYQVGDANPIVGAMNNYVAAYGMYSLMLMVDTQGKVIAVNSKDKSGRPINTADLYGRNFAKESWFQDSMNGRFLKSQMLSGTVVEDVYVDNDVHRIYGNEGLTLGYAAPVRDAEGQVIGVWKNFADFGLVEAIVADTYEDMKGAGLTTAELILLDRKGRVLVDCDPTGNGKLINRDLNSTVLKMNMVEAGVEAAKQTTTGKSGHGEATDERHGNTQICGWVPSKGALGYPGLGWSAIARVEKSQASSTAQTIRTTVEGILVVTVLTVIVVAGVVARFFTKPIHNLVARFKDIAQGEGDLTQRVEIHSNDELGQLGTWFNQFVQKIHDVIAEVSSATREVASASTQIAASSEEMAGGLNEQSKQVMQISAAVEEMSASIVEVARKSSDAANNAGESGKAALDGGKVVEQTIEGMQSINRAVSASAVSVQELGKRGAEIGRIIEVINDIADQTNLLALNAAIEAARAGEHGRGFAVVADEVRKLADRTTKATEEIGQSIQAIQTETNGAVARMNTGTEQVKQGVERATQAGVSLQRIVASAQAVAAMIQSIAAASEQQSAASEQVSKHVESINAVSRQASEGASQAATAAAQLSSKAEQLQALVGRFKVAGNEAKPPRPNARRAAA